MSISSSQDFIRGSAEHQSRLLTGTGMGVVALACAVLVGAATLYPRLTAPDGVELGIEVPFVGPGVAPGTNVVLHGQTVGRVTELDRTASDTVRMQLVLDEGQIEGLTDEFEVDYRPENYFGTSAVNLVAAASGNKLESGMELQRTPLGDYTMSTMIEQGSSTIDGTLTGDIISSLDKSVHYLDGATPWVETGVLVADRVARTQHELPTDLLARFNDILEAAPEFSDQAIAALMNIYDSPSYNRLPDGSVGVDDDVLDESDAGLALAGNQLFGQAGKLLASHDDELTPLIASITAVSDVFPHLSSGGMSPESARDVVRRLNSAFVDTPDGKRLRLRIVLDAFPSVAAALGLGPTAAPDGGVR
ncbi:Mce family protein [Aldersonia kunmingensis]|uniref:Mce family protein n=1 Tax=Aldersonia kunmingensis TaxID=408066 RepID=UPI0008367071|nr:Mce family protein [Aldersonia kunmingensis]